MSTIPRRSHLTEGELWARAARHVEEHGEVAVDWAASNASGLFANGDVSGSNIWLDILARVLHLQLPRTDETSH